jgi:hypothetical protein
MSEEGTYPTHDCWNESLYFEITPYVIARRCSLCKRLLTARERDFKRRLWGLFFDNVNFRHDVAEHPK